jgi:hypothetical protein
MKILGKFKFSRNSSLRRGSQLKEVCKLSYRNNDTLISGYQTAKNRYMQLASISHKHYDAERVATLLNLMSAIGEQIKAQYSKLDIRYSQYCKLVNAGGGLLGEFLLKWKKDKVLNRVFVSECQILICSAFDAIIKTLEL